MTDIDNMFERAVEEWRLNKGCGSAILPKTINDKIFILLLLQRIYNKNPTVRTIIVVNNFNEREEIINFITNQDEEENNQEFKRLIDTKCIGIYTLEFVEKLRYNMPSFFMIIYHCGSLCYRLTEMFRISKFRLVILNSLLSSNEDMAKLYNLAPLLNEFKQNELAAIRTSLPVEEERIGIDIDKTSKEYEDLCNYNEYITKSLNIFGSFDKIQEARVGNKLLNLSATEICFRLAVDNGWSEHMDMNSELNQQIDEYFNPSAIRERASLTYNIIQLRRNLLSDYNKKLDEILKIVNDNPNSKILIISNRGEFASNVTTYINQLSESNICGNYHDKMEPMPAIDEQGRPIFIKSGEHKGERKMMATQAQRTLNEKLFNSNKLRVLSLSNSPDKSLSVDVDTVIITSPICRSIEDYLYRLSNLTFPKNKLKLYTIYTINTLEEVQMENKELSANHIVLNNQKNNAISANNFDFIIAD